MGKRRTRASRTNSGGGVTGDHVATLQAGAYASHQHPSTTPVVIGQGTSSGNNINAGAPGNSGAAGGNETRPLNRAYMPIIKY